MGNQGPHTWLLSLSPCLDPSSWCSSSSCWWVGGHCPPHALRCRSPVSLGCWVGGMSAAAGRIQNTSMSQECCFQREGGDRFATTVQGMPLSLPQGQLQVKSSVLQRVLVTRWMGLDGRKTPCDPNANLDSVVCGIGTKKAHSEV